MQPISKIFLCLGALAAVASAPLRAQTPAPAASASPSAAATPATPAPEASPTPVPLASITAKIEADEEERGKIESEIKADTPVASLNATALCLEIDKALAESAKGLAAKPSLDRIHELDLLWQKRSEALGTLKEDLTKRLDGYNAQAARLDRIYKESSPIKKEWEQVLKDGGILPEWQKRLKSLADATAANRKTLQKRQTEVSLLLTPIQKQERQIAAMFAALKQAQPEAMSRLFVAESEPLWRVPLSGESRRLVSGMNLAQEWGAAWNRQWASLTDYARVQSSTFLVHILLFGTLLSALFWARRRMNAWADDEPALQRAALVFQLPTAMALAFSLLAFHWIYPQAPRLLIAIAGAAGLLPAILILRRLLDRHLFPILNLLVIFYFIDQLRTIAGVLPVAARLVFLGQMAAAIAFLAWMLWSGRLAPLRELDARLARIALAGVKAALGVFSAALAANVIGCVDLSNLLGDATLQSAYLAVVLYAGTRIVDGFLIGALSVDPLARLGMVRRHRTLLWQRTHRVFKAAALLFWTFETLNNITGTDTAWKKVLSLFWTAPANNHPGSLTILGQVAAFGAVIWAAFFLSRFIRFILEEDFYPRIRLERGLSYAISTMLHYAVLLFGFNIAATLAGVDMTKFNILVGAFGVGMGFGLQNIINNFVSGVILLFERPVKVGDVVQVDSATTGVVDRIGIRASIIRTGGGSEIIVPNGKLISDQVINWTLSNRQRGIDLPVSVAYGKDPCIVIELLKQVAAAHPLVAQRPAPNALLTDLGGDALQFKLTVWTDYIEQWGQIRSDLAVAIHATFEREGIRRPALTPAPAPAA